MGKSLIGTNVSVERYQDLPHLRLAQVAGYSLDQESLISCNGTASVRFKLRAMTRLQFILFVDLGLWLLIAFSIKAAFN